MRFRKRPVIIEAVQLRERIESGESLYWCLECQEAFSDFVQVRECPHCEETFNGSEEGVNCPSCNRPFSRNITEEGCPECLEASTEPLTLENLEQLVGKEEESVEGGKEQP